MMYTNILFILSQIPNKIILYPKRNYNIAPRVEGEETRFNIQQVQFIDALHQN